MNALNSILARYTSKPMGPVPSAEDWETIESVVGRGIPADFKQIVEHTGGANMGHCALRNPAEKSNMALALNEAALKREYIVWNDVVEEMMGVTLFPEPAGLIQLAHVDAGGFMLSYSGDSIVVCDRGSWETWDTDMGFADWMWTLFTERSRYSELGRSIWGASEELFGWGVF